MNSEGIIKVTRVLEYIGPRKWVEDTLAKSYITREGSPSFLSPPRSIREISRKEEEVK